MGYYGFFIIESIHTLLTLIDKFRLKSESKCEHLSSSNLGEIKPDEL